MVEFCPDPPGGPAECVVLVSRPSDSSGGEGAAQGKSVAAFFAGVLAAAAAVPNPCLGVAVAANAT
jgi:hypothetical protein